MRIDAKKLSEMIRKKKLSLLNKDPELVDTDARPDLNPMEAADLEMHGNMEKSMPIPKKTNIEDDKMAELDELGNMALTPKDKTRMQRLRVMMDGWDNSEE